MKNPYDWSQARNIDDYGIGDVITANNLMEKGYTYTLSKEIGDLSDYPEFTPRFTPQEMLNMGIFEGKYCNDCASEFPIEWFVDGKMSTEADVKLNYFGVKNRTSLADWMNKQMVLEPDNRGWFQWYCRFWLGRRIPEVDIIQINRWKEVKVYQDIVKEFCPNNMEYCKKERQLLLQWSYDCFV